MYVCMYLHTLAASANSIKTPTGRQAGKGQSEHVLISRSLGTNLRTYIHKYVATSVDAAQIYSREGRLCIDFFCSFSRKQGQYREGPL